MSTTTNTSAYPTDVEIGVIGGTGVYALQGVTEKQELELDTPFGKPSSKIVVGKLHGEKVAFLARHDTMHRLLPSEIPFKANIFALKLLGVKYLLTFGACGSLKEECAPAETVLVDQFLDRTKDRPSSFFGKGIVGHVSFGDPVCLDLNALIYKTVTTTLPDIKLHNGGCYVCMEGPAFSTRAESNMYRMLGGTVIGMTALQEAKLAREAEMAYACVALVTDYDCWHIGSVTVEEVMAVLKKNGHSAQLIANEVIKAIASNKFASKAHVALQGAILTHTENVPPQTLQDMQPIFGKYLK